MGIRRLTRLLGDTSDLIQATLDDLGLMMRSVIQEIDMSKSIKDPVTQAAACDVPGAKLDIDYLTVSDTTSIGVCLDSCASVAARQRFSRHSNSEGLV